MNSANEMNVEFDSAAKNESFARVIVASFITSTNPTLEEVSDIKTAVSEAVTNAIIHGYEKGSGKIHIRTVVEDRSVYIEVRDNGVGIENIRQAMEPLFTTKSQTGGRTFRDGIFLYGGFYGSTGGRIEAGRRNCGKNVEGDRCTRTTL